MKISKFMKGGVATALALLLTLSACGSTTNEVEKLESEAVVSEEVETLSFIGTWESKEKDDGTYFEATVTDDDEITVYVHADENYYIFWDGTYISETEIEETVNIISQRNDDIEMLSEEETTHFVYHNNDETMYFSYTNEDDVLIGVYMTHISTDYYTNIETADIPNNDDVDNETDENAVVDADTAEDTDTQEDATEETAQGDGAADEFAQNSADNTTAENSANDVEEIEVVDTQPETANSTATETKPTYTYTDKSETMYTTTGLNIRSGPMTTFGIIGSYEKGDTVKVTGTCNETGWSRVDVNGTTGYVDTNYLTYTAPVTVDTNTNNNTSTNTNTNNSTNNNASTTTTETYVSGGFPLYNYGYINGQYLGRVRIPSVGVNVAIYNTMAQSVCDATDSACFAYTWDPPEYGNYTINLADHSNQGFDAIKNCYIGCVMYVDGCDGNTYKYVCDRIDLNGHNDLSFLYDSSWNRLDKYGGVWAYTCNQDWQHISLVHFSPV